MHSSRFHGVLRVFLISTLASQVSVASAGPRGRGKIEARRLSRVCSGRVCGRLNLGVKSWRVGGRLYVRDDRGAKTYFDLDDTALERVPQSVSAPANESGRAIGRPFRAITTTEAFCLSTRLDPAMLCASEIVGPGIRADYPVGNGRKSLRKARGRNGAVGMAKREYGDHSSRRPRGDDLRTRRGR